MTEADEVGLSAAFPQWFKMDLDEAQRRIFAAIRVLTEHGFTLSPPSDTRYSVIMPNGWRRHQVVYTVGETTYVVERFWSWDRADSLAKRLNSIRRTAA